MAVTLSALKCRPADQRKSFREGESDRPEDYKCAALPTELIRHSEHHHGQGEHVHDVLAAYSAPRNGLLHDLQFGAPATGRLWLIGATAVGQRTHRNYRRDAALGIEGLECQPLTILFGEDPSHG